MLWMFLWMFLCFYDCFYVFYGHLYIFLVEMSIHIFFPFKKKLRLRLLLLWELFMYFEYKPFIRDIIWKYFPLLCGLFFNFFNGVFCSIKVPANFQYILFQKNCAIRYFFHISPVKWNQNPFSLPLLPSFQVFEGCTRLLLFYFLLAWYSTSALGTGSI